ncbi:TIGR03915 family putative DNA repair protein, partial [Bacteroidales bacterium OttesenSCG-928-M11]|nr:TIGR03915 family putative DNA repair protein [Bacteroidales bacterium OttesenSCG-928-M11]
MLYYIYDRTFEGLFTAVFDSFSRKELPEKFISPTSTLPLFVDSYTVITDEEKSNRVLNGLKERISKSALNMLSVCFLSESEEVEMAIFRYIQKSFRSKVNIEMNFADDDVLYLSQIYRKVEHESLYMKQFVRFQKTGDGIYFCLIEPRYNVLPLCSDFFADRYADQTWILYDRIRNYGIYYNLEHTEIIHIDKLNIPSLSGKLSDDQMNDDDPNFQELWRNYIQSINIKERKNIKLQRQHMPHRFWKYLTEK